MQLKFHLHKPLYIKQRFEELLKYRKLSQKYLLLMADCDDEMGYMSELQVDCVYYEVTCIVVWSFQEAARYIQTLKAYEGRS